MIMAKNRLPWPSWRTALAGMITALMLVILAGRAPLTSAFNSESITVHAQDCATTRVLFNIGDTVCAEASDVPLGDPPLRRFEWVAPDGTVLQLGPDIVTSSQNATIQIPTDGHFAQLGTWTVKTVDNSNNGYAIARFLVQDPTSAIADLSISMFGPAQVSAGSVASFTVQLTNNGPNDAQDVELAVAGATAATYMSESQSGGPAFTCVPPGSSRTGGSSCTIATLPVNATAVFVFLYQVDPAAGEDTVVSNTATVSSATAELFNPDNMATAAAIILGQQCALSCPAGVTVQKVSGQCGAAVDYATPGATGSNCGAVLCNPPSGSVFPLGTTNVVCLADTGPPCSFTVTVTDPAPPTITCPADITVSETTPGFGSAVVEYPAPLLNDNCPAPPGTCVPPSGSSFPVGTTVVNCDTSNIGMDHATCSFTVHVQGNGCTVICPSSIARSNDANQCGAVVTYAAPTTDGACGTVVCSPASGAFFPVGVTAVTCTSDAGPGCSFNVTIQDTQAPAISNASASPSSLWPPNHKMRDVTVDYQAVDNCGGTVTCTLSVTSNEPPSGNPDWEIIDAHHVRLRAARLGNGSGRVYTITITCRDENGNQSTSSVTVTVPHNQ
jgi:hypothetical protein